MKNVLILGKGYIGNQLSKHLKSSSDFKVFHVSKIDLDYTVPNNLDQFLSEFNINSGISYVINCSGYTGTPNIESCEQDKESCYNYNVTIPLYITKVCNKLNIPVIHIGSGCIYNGYDKIYNEDDVPNFGADSYESPFYSKTKDAFEKLSSHMERYIFRIRLPFDSNKQSKNYLHKILTYDNLVSKQNSLTCMYDFLNFVEEFLSSNTTFPTGIYNVVNRGSIDASSIVDMLSDNGLINDKWKFITEKEANLKVKRSNCILSTKKIEAIMIPMPDVNHSILKCIVNYNT